MKRRLLALFILVLLFAGCVWWWTARRSSLPETVAGKAIALAEKEGVTSFDGSKASPDGSGDGAAARPEANPLEKAVGLAIQGVNLFQGDKGLELWRLKASWAHLSRNGDTIDVDNPHVVYAMGDTGLPPSSHKEKNRDEGSDVAGTTPAPAAEGGAETAEQPAEADILDVTAKKGQVTDHQRHLTLWDDVVITRFDDRLTGPRMDYDSATRTMSFPEGAALESERGHGTAKVLHWDLANNVITGLDGVEVILKPRPAAEAQSPAAPGSAAAAKTDTNGGKSSGKSPDKP